MINILQKSNNDKVKYETDQVVHDMLNINKCPCHNLAFINLHYLVRNELMQDFVMVQQAFWRSKHSLVFYFEGKQNWSSIISCTICIWTVLKSKKKIYIKLRCFIQISVKTALSYHRRYEVKCPNVWWYGSTLIKDS